jgi:hypothetical protein
MVFRSFGCPSPSGTRLLCARPRSPRPQAVPLSPGCWRRWFTKPTSTLQLLDARPRLHRKLYLSRANWLLIGPHFTAEVLSSERPLGRLPFAPNPGRWAIHSRAAGPLSYDRPPAPLAPPPLVARLPLYRRTLTISTIRII